MLGQIVPAHVYLKSEPEHFTKRSLNLSTTSNIMQMTRAVVLTDERRELTVKQ